MAAIPIEVMAEGMDFTRYSCPQKVFPQGTFQGKVPQAPDRPTAIAGEISPASHFRRPIRKELPPSRTSLGPEITARGAAPETQERQTNPSHLSLRGPGPGIKNRRGS